MLFYNEANNPVGAVTLSESAANFEQLRIFFADDEGHHGSVDLFSPNNRFASLTTSTFTGTNMSVKSKVVLVSGTSIDTRRPGDYYYTGYWFLGDGSHGNTDKIAVTRVVGYRKALLA